jgi:hypothetical protein
MTGTAVAAVLCAAYVRLSHSDLAWFSVDQARDARIALDIVAGRSFPVVGPEVAGGPDPALAVAWLSAMTLASIPLTYRFAARFFGRPVALLSIAFVGTYPLAVIESKALWNMAPVPLFTVVFFQAMFSVIVGHRSVMIIAALATLGLLVQFHLSAISLVVVLACALAVFRPPMRARHVALGLGVMLTLMLPYVVAQSLTGFQDIRAVAASSSGQFRLRGPIELAELMLRVLFASPDVVSGLPALQETWHPPLVRGLHRLQAWSLVLGLVFVGGAALWPRLRSRAPDGAHASVVLVALGFVIPFVTLGARGDLRPHHFNITYPMPFIAAAFALTRAVVWIGAIAGPGFRRAVWSAVAITVAVMVVGQVDFHRQLWRTIRTAGAIVWTPTALELMPIRYITELTRILVVNPGADSMDVLRRVHGSWARNLSEAKGHFFDWMVASTPRQPPEVGRSLHYAIVRDEAGAAPAQGSRIARAGPYTVVEYQPLIVYSTWECADTFRDTGDRPGAEAVGWVTIRIPTAGPQTSTGYGLEPPRHWRGPVVACRGDISVAGPQAMRIVVSLRGPPLGIVESRRFT